MGLKTMIAQKREWKAFKRSVKNLPEDYQFVYHQMEKYIFKTTILNEEQIIEVFTDLIKLFEQASYDGKDVLDVTGDDVADFCDRLTADYPSYNDVVKADVEVAINKSIEKEINRKRK